MKGTLEPSHRPLARKTILRTSDSAVSQSIKVETVKHLEVPLSQLRIVGKRRPADPEIVRTLAASMDRIGLQTPITVRIRLTRPCGAELISGLHRVEAAKSLGWKSIRAQLLTNLDDAPLWQLEENLQRAELNSLDYAEHIAAWVTAEDTRARVSGQGVQKSMGRPEGGIALAARSLPIPAKSEEARRKAVERALKINGIADEAKLSVRQRGLADNQSALLALAKEATPAAQIAKVHELASGRRKLKRAVPIGGDSYDSTTCGDLNSPSQVPRRGDAAVDRFRAAWEQADLSRFWRGASLEEQARIVREVLLYTGDR